MITDSKLFKGLMSENENLKALLEENKPKFDDLTAEQQLSVEAWEEDKQLIEQRSSLKIKTQGLCRL